MKERKWIMIEIEFHRPLITHNIINYKSQNIYGNHLEFQTFILEYKKSFSILSSCDKDAIGI